MRRRPAVPHHGRMTPPPAHPVAEPAPPPQTPAAPPARPPLYRAPRQKVVAGVCGGLGRYCDIDPVIFRIVIGVLSVTGGLGLIFYGFAWLLVPMEGEDENEARRLLAGRVDGAALIAVLLALIGCGLFLSMLGNGGTLGFAALLSLAVVGSAVWSQRRRGAVPPGQPLDPAAPRPPVVHTVEAPPETKAPPSPGTPSWWRDPIVKDGTTGPVPTGYLWGPQDAVPQDAAPPRQRYGGDRYGGYQYGGYRYGGQVGAGRVRGPRSIGGPLFLLALIAGGLGSGLSWHTQPLGTSLQIGLSAALAVLGLGLAVSCLFGRTGFGTVFLTVLTALLLAGASAVPKDIGTQWSRQNWTATSAAAVKPDYTLGNGVGTLDLGKLAVPRGQTVVTSADVGLGRLKVVVPPDATVRVRVSTRFANLRLPGGPSDRFVTDDRAGQQTLPPPPGSRPAGSLVLRLHVDLGQVEVTRATS